MQQIFVNYVTDEQHYVAIIFSLTNLSKFLANKLKAIDTVTAIF